MMLVWVLIWCWVFDLGGDGSGGVGGVFWGLDFGILRIKFDC